MWIYGVVVVVVVVAGWLRLLPRWPGLAQQVALPPLDFFADARVLMARAPSTPVFAIGIVVALVGRAALLATILGFSRARFTFTLRFYLTALLPAVFAAGLDFSGRAILYAYLIWGGLLVTFATLFVLGAAPWIGRDTLHGALASTIRRRLRFGALLLYLVGVAFIGAVWRRPGDAAQVLAVPFSGGLTALMALRLSSPPVRITLQRVAIAAIAIVVALGAISIDVSRDGSDANAAQPRARRGSLLLVAGVDTETGKGAMFGFDPRAVGFTCEQTFYYSYRGPGRGGRQGDAQCPIRTGARYAKQDTTRPLRELAASLRAQVDALPAPVVVVTHSQGAWIAWSALTSGGTTRAAALVMLAPFNEGLAPYPATGRSGAGAAGGTAVRMVTDLGRSLGINQFDPDAPLARELQATPGAVERLVSQHLPSTIRGAAVIARGDLPLEPRAWPNGLPETCPGWLTHAALPTAAVVSTTINRFLAGDSLPACPRVVAAIGHATDAFGAPSPNAAKR